MRQILFLTLILVAIFAFGATIAHLIDQQTFFHENQEHLFQPASYALKNRRFAIIVIGVNNGASVEKTIDSVFSQNYDPFHLIYIDDASDDGSFELVQDYLAHFDRPLEVNLIQNEKRLGPLANLFRAIQLLADDEIVLVLHGEDFLAHEWVLQRLNAYYEDPETWVACAQSIAFPTFQKGPVFESCDRLKSDFGIYLKSFYAALFKKIRDSDFIYSGQFLPAAAEFAYMTPILEMGKDHFRFIPEVLYVHNQNGIYQEDQEMRLLCKKWVRSLEPYPKLSRLQVHACGD